MKIVAIRGKNLASLEGEFEIDFSQEPLRSSGIFVITGPTGAGKSTILDALCLALFDEAPRLNKAEASVNVNDVEEKTITQKDSRTILRRGTSDGFAEVDFIALNGNTYRTRWTVRRARGKIEGALQVTSIQLTNLSTGEEQQGTKKNLLDQIVELIGLTFDQFTRAVLLAQGDFANFLKAKQNEKAELLEKLTGTEVYSQLSVLIYQRTEEAKKALELVLQRMQDIKLLPEEEIRLLRNEKETLEKEEEPLKGASSRIEKKLDWLRLNTQWQQEVTQAEEGLKTIEEWIRNSAPRREYLAWVDVSQEIRDTYLDKQGKVSQQQQLQTSLAKAEQELDVLSRHLKESATLLDTVRKESESSQDTFNKLKPDISKAKALDLKLSSELEKGNDVRVEVDTLKKKAGKTEKEIVRLNNEKAAIEKEIRLLTDWFAEHVSYQEVVIKMDWVTNLLSNHQSLQTQIKNAEESLRSGKEMLKTDSAHLKVVEEEARKLHALFPAEILQLRGKLEAGTPCPVCGSVHHPFSEEQEQSVSLNEAELERSRKKVAGEIDALKERIEKTKTNVTAFTTYMENYTQQQQTVAQELRELLHFLPDWETRAGGGVLQKELTTLSSTWNKNKERLDFCKQQIGNVGGRLEAETKTFGQQEDAVKEKESVLTQVRLSYQALLKERALLLDNKPVEEVETHFTSQIERLAARLEQTRKQKEAGERQKANLTGTVSQQQKDKERLEKEADELNEQIKKWLDQPENPVSTEQVDGLMSRSKEWINRERAFFDELKQKEVVARTTLSERQQKQTQHQTSENKPEEDETQEVLLWRQNECAEKTKQVRNRLMEISLLLLTQEKAMRQRGSFEKEKTEKSDVYENWAKLNELLGSASGNKFKTIAQGYTLDVLLGYANKHLEELTRRYRLEKIPGTLALQVVDNDMLGEVRSVHSLSGGESFLISLALALGLSSLSSNRMKIESLFIDEGFGALDVDTLSIAMDALDSLQTQGRKIGVISHVEEMKERITTQIQVRKLANGRSEVRVSSE